MARARERVVTDGGALGCGAPRPRPRPRPLGSGTGAAAGAAARGLGPRPRWAPRPRPRPAPVLGRARGALPLGAAGRARPVADGGGLGMREAGGLFRNRSLCGKAEDKEVLIGG